MFNFKGRMFKKQNIVQENEKEQEIYIERGVFKVDDKLIAGAYYSDNEIKAIATDIGCVRLNDEPKLVEPINLKTTKIESLLIKLKYKKVEKFIFIKELC